MKLAFMHGDAHVAAENKKPTGPKAGANGKRTKAVRPLSQGLEQAKRVMNQILDSRSQRQAQMAAAGTHPLPPSYTAAGGVQPPTPQGVEPRRLGISASPLQAPASGTLGLGGSAPGGPPNAPASSSGGGAPTP